MALTSRPVACTEQIAATRPAPGPRTNTSMERMSGPGARLAVEHAVSGAAQVPFDEELLGARHLVDDLAQARDLFVGEILDARVGVDAGRLHELLSRGVADAGDVGKGDDHALLRRYVDARDSCHLAPYP